MMVRLSFYGGINEIGGSKFLLEDGHIKLLLDFGFPYKRYKRFYEEYLRPRSGAGLLDPLVMGLLPPLEGLYREDLQPPDLWRQFKDDPCYRRVGDIDGVLLSHAHLDHSGYISFLREDIPVYTTATTAFIAKAIQDSGRADFDQQVCYFSPAIQDCPLGWQQPAFLSGKVRQQRRFCLADREPAELGADAVRFWEWGFWEKTAGQKELKSLPLSSHTGCPLNVRCFPVDHSIPGACAWGVETTAGWIVYSGDLRLHGKRGKLTEQFVAEAACLNSRALIIEGTNVQRDSNISEDEVFENGLKAISTSRSLVIADFSPRDVDRLLTFLHIARSTGRKLAILPKDAYLLKTIRLLETEIPDIAQEDNLVIYQETTASKSPNVWVRNLYEEYGGKVVLAKDVSSAQSEYIICFSFFDLDELPSIRPEPGSLYVYSSSEPHDEEQEIDFRRLHNWLEHFQMRGFGLPVEKNGIWEIPDGEKGLHASGHACGPDLLKIVRDIQPAVLIPVHGEHSDFYVEKLCNSEIKVILPQSGGVIEL